MRIAVLGVGAIGSVFAFQLAKAGHSVTAIARGKRLAQLQADQAIVLVSSEKAPVEVAAGLDPSVPYDLLLVTVLAPQVGEVLPAVRASAARTVMFMFNTFEPLDLLRDAAGRERFAFGFPGGVFSLLREGRMERTIRTGTTSDNEVWARVFTDAGIPTVVEQDMHSWLPTHAALVAPLMAVSVVAHKRGAGISWTEATTNAAAMGAGFRLVRELGNTVTPAMIATTSRLPRWLIASLLWCLSRTKTIRDLGILGPGEARMLIDMMEAAGPGRIPELLAIRP